MQVFTNIPDKPVMVDLIVEEGQKIKILYASNRGFHGIDLDTSAVFDLYIPAHVSRSYSFSIYHCPFLCTTDAGIIRTTFANIAGENV